MLIKLISLARRTRAAREATRQATAERNRLRAAERVVLGAGQTDFPGWEATDREVVDVACRDDFARLWAPGSRRLFLAEHVWEHLPAEAAAAGLRNCREFLAPGGCLRIAVPDGFHPDPEYIEHVRPGGTGAGADDHHALYTVDSLSKLVREAGLTSEPVEYWDAAGTFHSNYTDDRGRISRCLANDARNADGKPNYSSLIIDCVRPA